MKHSLSLRLVLGALVWLAVALGFTGYGLGTLFERQAENAHLRLLGADLTALMAALDWSEDEAPLLSRRPADPRFDRPYGGRYWQIATPDGVLRRSRSLWDQVIELPDEDLSDGLEHRHLLPGPQDQQLLVLERSVVLPGHEDKPLRLAVALDRAEIAAARAEFDHLLWIALGALGLGLTLAVAAQTFYGLWPLRRISAALADMRGGGKRQLVGQWPVEVRPLVEALNALLAADAERLERGRRQAADLAHALKSRLAVLANDLAGHPSAHADIEALRRQVERHLARARAAGAAQIGGAICDAGAAAAELARSLARLPSERPLDWSCEGSGRFAGDREDLVEMLGNLLDNARLWTKSRVAITLTEQNGRLRITIDDDGPGMPAQAQAAALARFGRLDENAAGSGLGLAIAADIAELYGGKLRLETAPIGGLRACLILPCPPESPPPAIAA